ncbi:MAG: hypothetical protein R3D67_00130 [Hyphomicrobiaceae bacterium]
MKSTAFFALIALVLGCGAVGSHTAAAATVQDIVGTVQINRGGGYRAISGPTIVERGDTVVAKQNSSAVIVYEDGCRQTVEPGRIVSVGARDGLRSVGSLKDEPVRRECVLSEPADHYLLKAAAVGAGAVAVGVGIVVIGTDKKIRSVPDGARWRL